LRLPRMRLTIRSVMLVVAVLALLIGADQLVRRATLYRTMAARFGKLEYSTRNLQIMSERRSQRLAARAKEQVEGWGPFNDDQHRASVLAQTKDWIEAGYLRQEADVYAAETEWYSQLRQRYERAASHTWEPLAPDPPGPTVKLPFRMPR
jgi:hypothetical protein